MLNEHLKERRNHLSFIFGQVRTDLCYYYGKNTYSKNRGFLPATFFALLEVSLSPSLVGEGDFDGEEDNGVSVFFLK